MGDRLFPLAGLARCFAEHEFCRRVVGIDLQLFLKFLFRGVCLRGIFGEINSAKPIMNAWRLWGLLQNLLILRSRFVPIPLRLESFGFELLSLRRAGRRGGQLLRST